MEEIPQQSRFSGRRIVLYGPESTGKSTLGKQLSLYYNEPLVLEYAREYLQKRFDVNSHICSYDDIVPIAIGQRHLEIQGEKDARDLVILDTNLLETAVYSEAYFSKVPQELEKAIATSSYDLYLLMDIDVEWTPDDLRDKPQERVQMFNFFEKTLVERKLDYSVVSGIDDERLKNAIQVIESSKQ
ncbi:AAA family ATPase [Nonlabens ponticola]|uniref:NadR-like protein n=1 Tax=Nonlabens ponticola TaxID=2496866 RepID=A0A3S9MVY0_9FLAO|nr:ATP-binding protein [Nonlabens ponticola]AZQ43289.1 nadR-like protein [Nonlabens ponticola]